MGTLLEGLFFAPTEWLLILIVVLLMFGGKKIPELMKGLGSGIRNFKEAIIFVKRNEQNAQIIRRFGIQVKTIDLQKK